MIANIQVGIERLKDANRKIKFLEEVIFQFRNKNETMVKKISYVLMYFKTIEDEVSKLKQDKVNLLDEVALNLDERNSLLQILYCSKEERKDLYKIF